MTTNDIITSITTWSSWAAQTNNKRYDIALLKIWIQFEKFLGALFVTYATGNESESGFKPDLRLQFQSEEHLNAFLREGNKRYIDYIKQIERLSKHIFLNNPFDIIFNDSTYNSVYKQIVSIRNYIAHESGEAKSKMINECFSGNARHFKEPNDFLQERERSNNTTYFTYYTEAIKNISTFLVNPIS